MAWSILIAAIGLLFVFEGILPFSSPHLWRQMVARAALQNDRSLRIMGLASMLFGLLVIIIARVFFS